MSIYLDTNCVVPLQVAEPTSVSVSLAVETSDGLPTISDYGVGEFGSVVSRYVRMGLVSPDEAHGLLSAFDEWLATSATVIRVESQDIARASRIVRNFELKLRFPDALHIAVCANRGLPLMTLDRPMATAAQTLGVKVMMPG